MLDVSLPLGRPGNGVLIAETYLARNEAGILDIVVPSDSEVESWCCYGRGAKRGDWVVMTNHPDLNGRYLIPVVRTHFYVWGFGEATHEAGEGERIWRVHGHNVAFEDKGRDVWLRFVVRLTMAEELVTVRRLPLPKNQRTSTGAERSAEMGVPELVTSLREPAFEGV